MRSVLVGNGINIQFGGKAYSNDFIMKRIFLGAQTNKYEALFDGQVSGEIITGIFKGFIDTANKIINGDYDSLGDDDDQEAIKDFMSRYTEPVAKYHEIMLEDWFLLIRVFFITNSDLKDQWQSVKQGFEHLILDAIYNEGMLTSLHKNMNKKVKRFFAGFDYIFSLNYDNNLEVLTGKEVFHLHGDYSVPADSENPDTVRGYLRQQAGQMVSVSEFHHCFCNAMLDYSGDLKFRRALAIRECTIEMNRWLNLSKHDKLEYEKQIALLKEKDENTFQLVSTYVQRPDLHIGTNYHFDELSNLQGELYIIGLSPNNDGHIFKCINESKIKKVYFYYFSKDDKAIPITKPFELLPVNELWQPLDVEKKKYNCCYPIPNSPEVDKFIDVFNEISFDPVPKNKIIDELNAIPQFEVDRLYGLMKEKLEAQKSRGNPKSEGELHRQFIEISCIGLREGVLPSVLFMMYVMNAKSKGDS